MTERSYFYDGIVTGDATLAPYTDDEFAHAFTSVLCPTFESTDSRRFGAYVLGGYKSELEVVQLSDASVTVGAGMGIIRDRFYETDAGVALSLLPDISSPYYGAATIVRAVGLRKNHIYKTVRAFVGPEFGSAGEPLSSLVQVDGEAWELALAEVTLTNGAISSIVDYRNIIHAPEAVGAGARVGGNVSNWNVSGATAYYVRSVHKQVGVTVFSLDAADASHTESVVFPRPYALYPLATEPIVFLSIMSHGEMTSVEHYLYVESITYAGFDAVFERTTTGVADDITFAWMAVGEL